MSIHKKMSLRIWRTNVFDWLKTFLRKHKNNKRKKKMHFLMRISQEWKDKNKE
jgi:hypothetical protein